MRYATIFLILIFMTPEGSVWGQSGKAAPVELNVFVRKALKQNPEIKSAKARFEAAQAEVPQSWRLEKPWFFYDVMVQSLETRVGPQEHRLGLMQEIPFPLKLPLRAKAARIRAMQAQHQVLHMEQEVRTQVISAYAELMSLQQILNVLREEQAMLQQLASILQSRYVAKETNLADIAKVEAELAKVAGRILRAEERRTGAEELLKVLLNMPERPEWDELPVPPLPETGKGIEELKDLAFQYRHGLVIKRLALQEKEVRHKLAKWEYLPDIEIGFQYVQVGDGTTTRPDDGKDAWMIPLKVSLPLWIPQVQGGIREARQLERSASEELQQAMNKTSAEVVQKHTAYVSARERLEIYRTGWIPQAEEAFSASLAAYQGGRSSVLDVLDNLRLVLEAKAGYWKNYEEVLSAFAELEKAIGIPLKGFQESEGKEDETSK